MVGSQEHARQPAGKPLTGELCAPGPVTQPVTRGLLCTLSAGGTVAVGLCLAVSTSTLMGSEQMGRCLSLACREDKVELGQLLTMPGQTAWQCLQGNGQQSHSELDSQVNLRKREEFLTISCQYIHFGADLWS